jgi:outer membrane protein assembly factor BamA
VRFHGAHGKSAAELVREMKLAPETPYTPAALDGARKRIIALYADHGHPYVSIDPTASGWNATHDRVDVVLTVDEGPEVRFGEILVRGHFKTLESVVLRDLPFRPGSLFSAEALDRARRNLQHHAIFNGVKVTPVGLASGINPVPVLVEIQERYDDWGTPVASVGLSTDIGFSESLGYFWGNVFGLGGSIELRGEVAESLDLSQFPTTATAYFDPHNPYWRLLALTLRYVHPHFILPSLRAELQGVLRKENTVRLGEVISEGFSLSISYVPSPSLRVFGRYDFTSAAQQNVDLQRLPGRSDYLVGVRDTTTTGKLTVGVVWDDRVGLATSVAARPLGFELDHTHNFVVLSGQAQRYQPLGHDITLIVNLRGDWGVPIGESALPAVERFFAGGDTNTRGFDTDKLKTEVIRGDVSPAPGAIGFRIVPEGGNIRFLGTIELQFPIATLVGFPWVGALFFDAGSIFDDPRLIDPANDIKASVGLTLFRILTPVGPLSFEYAYPITQSLAEEQWKKEAWYLHWPGRIHFNWGIPIIR